MLPTWELTLYVVHGVRLAFERRKEIVRNAIAKGIVIVGSVVVTSMKKVEIPVFVIK